MCHNALDLIIIFGIENEEVLMHLKILLQYEKIGIWYLIYTMTSFLFILEKKRVKLRILKV